MGNKVLMHNTVSVFVGYILIILNKSIFNGPKKSTLPFDSVVPKCIRFKLYVLQILINILFDYGYVKTNRKSWRSYH